MSLTLRADVSTTSADGGMVLLNERTGRYWHLNETGSFILRALLDGATEEQTARRLTARYPIALPQAVDDVATLLTTLRRAELVATS